MNVEVRPLGAEDLGDPLIRQSFSCSARGQRPGTDPA